MGKRSYDVGLTLANAHSRVPDHSNQPAAGGAESMMESSTTAEERCGATPPKSGKTLWRIPNASQFHVPPLNFTGGPAIETCDGTYTVTRTRVEDSGGGGDLAYTLEHKRGSLNLTVPLRIHVQCTHPDAHSNT